MAMDFAIFLEMEANILVMEAKHRSAEARILW